MSAVDVNAAFKEMYASKVADLKPQEAILVDQIPFSPAGEALGSKFVEPIRVQRSFGLTFSQSGSGGGSLNANRGGAIKNAEVQGANILLQDLVSTEDFDKMKMSKAHTVARLGDLTDHLLNDVTFAVEMTAINGGYLGEISSTTVNVSGTKETVTFDASTWAPGIWSGAVGMPVEFRLSSNNTTLLSSGADAIFTVDSVNFATRAVTFAGTSGGITALGGISAAHDCFMFGTYGNAQTGLRDQVNNTGTLFGLSGATYPVWRGNSQTITGNLTGGKLQDAAAVASYRGAKGRMWALVSDRAFARLNDNSSALRALDSGYDPKKLDQGHKELCFHYPKGELVVKPHSYVFDGECIVVPEDKLKRVGSVDIEFKSATVGGSEAYFFHDPSNDGYLVRCGTHQAIYCAAPSHSVLISGFTV